MDLSLSTLVEAARQVQEEHRVAVGQDRRRAGGGGGQQGDAVEEREHMFDKVLTPSDVGKLNRLVVPKQHAERFFPVDAATGTQLCFEDRGGAPWRFRYSYWGSSQSYVMTKGWSSFVRAASLAAGDTVSFYRGAGGRYFIDYRHCERRRREISFAPAVSEWPFLDRMQRSRSRTTGGEAGASTTTNAAGTVPVAAAHHHHDAEVGPSGTKSFRLFGFNVECTNDDDDAAMAEEEYDDDDN